MTPLKRKAVSAQIAQVDSNEPISSSEANAHTSAQLLNEELLLSIFSSLSLSDIIECSLVSRKWNRVANNNRVRTETSEILVNIFFCLYVDFFFFFFRLGENCIAKHF